MGHHVMFQPYRGIYPHAMKIHNTSGACYGMSMDPQKTICGTSESLTPLIGEWNVPRGREKRENFMTLTAFTRSVISRDWMHISP